MSAVQGAGFASDTLPLEPFAPMRVDDLGEVQTIESDVYPYPWTRGNFLDSLYSGYESWTLRDGSHALIGYFLMMLAVDEAHLLNITVRRDWQRQGVGRMLLDRVVALARERRMGSILLEVRPSNERALAVYQRYGFSTIGRRKAYYPAAGDPAAGDPAAGTAREDAIVMRLPL